MLTEGAVRRHLEKLRQDMYEERQALHNNKGIEPEGWQESRRRKILGLACAIGELMFVLNGEGSD